MVSNSKGMSVRELLGSDSTVPDFDIKLLPGWERHNADDDDKARFEDRIKRRFMELHRPDLYGSVKSMLDESYAKMRRQGAVAFFAPTGKSEDAVLIPGSIVVSDRKSPAGGTLDDLVRQLMRDYGAAPLFGDVRFMRYEREKVITLQESTIIQTSLIYLTPIPGFNRKRALQFVASFGRPVEMPAEDDKVRAWKFAFDACVSTLRWKV